jgi:hypothetical protein
MFVVRNMAEIVAQKWMNSEGEASGNSATQDIHLRNATHNVLAAGLNMSTVLLVVAAVHVVLFAPMTAIFYGALGIALRFTVKPELNQDTAFAVRTPFSTYVVWQKFKPV